MSKISHRLDGYDMQRHYALVAHRIGKYARRLEMMGFYFDKDRDVFHRGENYVTLEYVHGRCDFTKAEFNRRYRRPQDEDA